MLLIFDKLPKCTHDTKLENQPQICFVTISITNQNY